MLGVPRHYVTEDVDPAIREAVDVMLGVLRDLGFEVVAVDVPAAESAQDHVYTLLYADWPACTTTGCARGPSSSSRRPSSGSVSVSASSEADAARSHSRRAAKFRAGLRRVFERSRWW